MRRSSSKKGAERRKRVRSKSHPFATSTTGSVHKKFVDSCQNCSKDLKQSPRALFVEEEVGRIFCSEHCIAAFFNPEIERLERDYQRRLSSSDLSGEDRESLAHLRWITLQEPDEVWREKTLKGDNRYTLISEFQPGNRRLWCVCVCLFLRGEPSFLYIAFPTRNAAMVNYYRRGERIELERGDKVSGGDLAEVDSAGEGEDVKLVDRLADAWTEDETFLAQMNQERASTDIPPEEFAHYQGHLEETLETPDEVWSVQMGGQDSARLYHFIRHYPKDDPATWYLIVARETEDDEEIEILDAFPTRDANLVNRYRRGEQEVGHLDARPTERVVH